jgi:hypothetical protein
MIEAGSAQRHLISTDPRSKDFATPLMARGRADGVSLDVLSITA